MRGEAPDLAARTEYEVTVAGRFARLTGQDLWSGPDEQAVRGEVERRMLAGFPVDPERIAQIRDAATPKGGMAISGTTAQIQQIFWDIDRQRQLSAAPVGSFFENRPTNETAAGMMRRGRR